MYKKLGLIILTIALSSCVSMYSSMFGMGQKDSDYIVQSTMADTSMFPSMQAYLNFEGKEYLQTEENKKAEAELRSPSKVTGLGYVMIQTRSNSIDSAKGSNNLVIIKDSTGKEILRETGNNDTPNYVSGTSPTVWYSFSAFKVKEATYPLTVRIISKYDSSCIWEYVVSESI